MHFEVEKYMGFWYEIARYPTWFEPLEAYNTTAEYSLAVDGSINVHNSMVIKGKSVDIYGKATVEPLTYFRDGVPCIASLKVIFPESIETIGPNYCIRSLFTNDNGDYLYSIVSNPELDSLFVLSRFPNPDPESFNSILTYLERDFDVTRIVHVPQYYNFM
jgi:apolipoprotein D and lipocalin family protein